MHALHCFIPFQVVPLSTLRPDLFFMSPYNTSVDCATRSVPNLRLWLLTSHTQWKISVLSCIARWAQLTRQKCSVVHMHLRQSIQQHFSQKLFGATEDFAIKFSPNRLQYHIHTICPQNRHSLEMGLSWLNCRLNMSLLH